MAGRLGLVGTINECTYAWPYQYGDFMIVDLLYGNSGLPEKTFQEAQSQEFL